MDEETAVTPTTRTNTGLGSFFANARKKMEQVASTLDSKASALFDKRSSIPRCVVPPDVFNTFVKKLAHPCNSAFFFRFFFFCVLLVFPPLPDMGDDSQFADLRGHESIYCYF